MEDYLIFDAHLDLSMNAMEWNRDLRWSVEEIRDSEKGMTDLPDRANNTVSFPAMRAGNIGLCVATQIARYVKRDSKLPGWHSPEQAWAQTKAQLEWYKTMEVKGELVQITDHTCQLAGNCDHVGIGTDLDVVYGKEQSPKDLDTIADLQELPQMLEQRGYSRPKIEQILSKNFIAFLERVWA